MSRRLSSDSAKSASSNLSRRSGKGASCKVDTSIANNGDFNWDKYLQQTGMHEAPAECFKQQVFDDPNPNKFQLSDKLEAKDARNPSAISVATVVQIQGLRLRLRLDGTDGCNDFWRLVDSKDIFPLGTCEAHGGLLQPPLGYTRNVSTWPGFLQRTLRNANHASSDCFYQEPKTPISNMFEIGMKLEAVDKKNPYLICPATIGNIDQDQVFISFDGWRGAFDYWCSYDSRDLFPAGWCQRYNHPLQVPGKKGDNPVVVEKLKLVSDQRKRQTRSVKNNLEQKQLAKDVPPAQSKEKPVRRRRVDSIKATKSEDVKEEVWVPDNKESDVDDPPLPNSPLSDGSASSGESDSSQEASPGKRLKVPPVASEDGNTTSSSQSSSSQALDSSSQSQHSDQEVKKLERKERKQKRKLARMLKRAGIAQEQIDEMKNDGVAVSLNLTSEQVALLTSPRKRLYGAESDFAKTKLKKKKKKRRLIEQSYTRMEGFGLKGGEPTSSTPPTCSPTSPSFLESLASSPPTSLFGVDKSQIVRDATQGWPSTLRIGSVVTSDNKLGRFDKAKPEPPLKPESFKTETTSFEAMTSQCVSTTTTDEEANDQSEQAETNRTTPSPSVSSTTPLESVCEDRSNVSSTTISSSSSNVHAPVSHSSSSQLASIGVTSTVSTTPPNVKKRSRNPKRWSINDVVDYVREKEPALHNHLYIFQKHEIDGRAFLLLNSTNIVKYMGIKLGPALKLCSVVENLKTAIAKYLSKRKPSKE